MFRERENFANFSQSFHDPKQKEMCLKTIGIIGMKITKYTTFMNLFYICDISISHCDSSDHSYSCCNSDIQKVFFRHHYILKLRHTITMGHLLSSHIQQKYQKSSPLLCKLHWLLCYRSNYNYNNNKLYATCCLGWWVVLSS